MEKEMSSQQMVLGQLDIYIQKNEVIYLSIYLTSSVRSQNGMPLVVQWFKHLPANAGDTGSISAVGRFQMPWGN